MMVIICGKHYISDYNVGNVMSALTQIGLLPKIRFKHYLEERVCILDVLNVKRVLLFAAFVV